MNRGKWLIIGIFGLAAVLALFAWNHQRLRGRQVLAYFGEEVALTIRLAPDVELWQFTEPVPDQAIPRTLDDLMEVSPAPLALRTSISARPGWTHARQALIEDRSYDWNAVASPPPGWTHAIHFRGTAGETMLLLDLDRGRIRSIENPRVLVLSSKMTDGFRTYFRAEAGTTE